MRLKLFSAVMAVCVFLVGLCACDVGIVDKKYEPTADNYFTFVKSEDGKSYEISAKEAELPATVRLPIVYAGLPVSKVAKDGFKNRDEVKSVVIPYSYTEIGDSAFYGCDKLKKVYVDSKVQADESGAKTSLTIDGFAFAYCGKLVDLDLGGRVDKIGAYAFKETGITEFKSENVNSIGDCAFEGCTGLLRVTLSEKLGNVGKTPFNKCKKVLNITNKSGVSTDSLREGLVD